MRAAIYTRKSTEDGLEQDFNSLDAQREACAAYIQSQRHEGWTKLEQYYEDGGWSGGNLNRPGLQSLLTDISKGIIDVVVVYKIDRLTRSLSDFAKLVDVFDQQKVTFVSVTQQFNTTSSMGRLTLNVLLSFAQYEREITSERLKDKIAASKTRGIFMGGTVPLGYKSENGKLLIDEEGANIIHHIFEYYKDLRNGYEVMKKLRATGMKRPSYVSKKGTRRAANYLSTGTIYKILSNPIYIGKVRHHGKEHKGQHQAIISRHFGMMSNPYSKIKVEGQEGDSLNINICLPLQVNSSPLQDVPSHPEPTKRIILPTVIMPSQKQGCLRLMATEPIYQQQS